jgi:hypothetical protein
MTQTTPTDWKAAKAARAAAAAAMQAAFPHLVPISDKVDALQAAAKNMRIELARAFPGVRFSVKSRRYSGGDAIDVRWMDGPTDAQVDAIINRYSGGSFDGMRDCYDYSRDAWTDAFGDAKFVFSHRDYSDAAITACGRTACAKWGVSLPLDTIAAAYRSGELFRIRQQNFGARDFGDLVAIEMHRRTWALTKVAA